MDGKLTKGRYTIVLYTEPRILLRRILMNTFTCTIRPVCIELSLLSISGVYSMCSLRYTFLFYYSNILKGLQRH